MLSLDMRSAVRLGPTTHARVEMLLFRAARMCARAVHIRIPVGQHAERVVQHGRNKQALLTLGIWGKLGF